MVDKKKTIEELENEYKRLLHAMQSGVAFLKDKGDQSPKHLRVGINSATVNDAALVRVLIAKGIVTLEEYFEALVEEVKREVERYRQMIAREQGVDPSQINLA